MARRNRRMRIRKQQGEPLGAKAPVSSGRPLIDRRLLNRDILGKPGPQIIDPKGLATVWRNYVANTHFVMSRKEAPDSEILQASLGMLSGEQRKVNLPWRKLILHLGTTYNADVDQQLTIPMGIPTVDELAKAIGQLQAETVQAGGKSLLVLADTAAVDLETAQKRAIVLASTVKKFEPVEAMFAFMRIVRNSLAELSVLEVLAEKTIEEQLTIGRNARTREVREKAKARGHEAIQAMANCAAVLNNPFWGHFFGAVYDIVLALRPRRPIDVLLPATRSVAGIERYQSSEIENDPGLAPAGPAVDVDLQQIEVAVQVDPEQAPPEDEPEPVEEIPILEGLRPIPAEDPRRKGLRTSQYRQGLHVIDVFEPEGELNKLGYVANPFEYPLTIEPGEENYWIICDLADDPAPEVKQGYAAYLFRPARKDNPADKTAWVQAAELPRKEARQHSLFVKKFKHNRKGPAGDDQTEPAHIRNIKKYIDARLRKERKQKQLNGT